MTKYYPKALTLLAETNMDDVRYRQDPTGPTYVRIDAVPNGQPLVFLVISIACLLSALSNLLEGNWLQAGLLALATVGFAWAEWKVRKQWQAIQDALPD
jgi:hypothetical protein